MGESETLEIFGERLKELIRNKKLTLKSFAEQIGMPTSTISGWTLKISLANIHALKQIAIFFGVSTDYLLGLED